MPHLIFNIVGSFPNTRISSPDFTPLLIILKKKNSHPSRTFSERMTTML